MSNAGGRTAPVVLVVLDGWGWRPDPDGNAIAMAQTPTWDGLVRTAPRALLEASGVAVGLPEGQMGNSEVGHLNLGAGRIVPQDLVRINQSIASGDFARLPVLIDLARDLRRTNGTLHLAGLLGPGGVHAIDTHWLAVIRTMLQLGVSRIAIHGFLDGRDSPPRGAPEVVAQLLGEIAHLGEGRTHLATLTGRYFAMDRDHRWARTRLAWEAMVRGVGHPVPGDPVAAIRAAHDRGETDEFVHPLVMTTDGNPVAPIRDGDAVFFVNYRSDRMRQIAASLVVPDFSGFDIAPRPDIRAASMTQYDATLPMPPAFAPFSMARILTEVLSSQDRSQFRTAETEKYPHVTYFFNGGYEPPWPGEERLLIPSQQVATYDLAPVMSAPGITDALCTALARGDHDFYLANFANADMVGHTGVLPAVIEAVEAVDQSLDRIVRSAAMVGARLLITADHGNAEQMTDPYTGGPHTAHTTNPVPCLGVGTGLTDFRPQGALCDIAPTILRLLGLAQPEEMTGQSLLLSDQVS